MFDCFPGVKALKRTLSFGKFTRNYQALLYRIQKRYGVEDPTTALQFNHLMEYVERLNSEFLMCNVTEVFCPRKGGGGRREGVLI